MALLLYNVMEQNFLKHNIYGGVKLLMSEINIQSSSEEICGWMSLKKTTVFCGGRAK